MRGYMSNFCFILVGTKKYFSFGVKLLESMETFLKGEYDVLFISDFENMNKYQKHNVFYSEVPNEPWPFPTLKRFHYILNNKKFLKKYNNLLYLDTDMRFVSDVKLEELISERLVVQHQMMIDCMPEEYTFETNPNSTAFISHDERPPFYYQNNVFGGSTDNVLKMCKHLSKNIDTDLSNNIVAKWWDESHANRYYIKNAPTKILSLEYNCPEDRILDNKKIIHICKDNECLRK